MLTLKDHKLFKLVKLKLKEQEKILIGHKHAKILSLVELLFGNCGLYNANHILIVILALLM